MSVASLMLLTAAGAAQQQHHGLEPYTPFCRPVSSQPQFWSAEFRTCLPCKPCVVTLAPCTATSDAVCGDADAAAEDDAITTFAEQATGPTKQTFSRFVMTMKLLVLSL